MSGTTPGLPPAVIDHAATPTQIYCRNCAYQAINSPDREKLSVDQVGDVLLCDGCGTDIAMDGTLATQGDSGGY